MTIDEINAEMSKPQNEGRVAVLVREDHNEFVAEWDGIEYRAGNPFGLDSRLTDGGVPAPRNLFLVSDD